MVEISEKEDAEQPAAATRLPRRLLPYIAVIATCLFLDHSLSHALPIKDVLESNALTYLIIAILGIFKPFIFGLFRHRQSLQSILDHQKHAFRVCKTGRHARKLILISLILSLLPYCNLASSLTTFPAARSAVAVALLPPALHAFHDKLPNPFTTYSICAISMFISASLMTAGLSSLAFTASTFSAILHFGLAFLLDHTARVTDLNVFTILTPCLLNSSMLIYISTLYTDFEKMLSNYLSFRTSLASGLGSQTEINQYRAQSLFAGLAWTILLETSTSSLSQGPIHLSLAVLPISLLLSVIQPDSGTPIRLVLVAACLYTAWHRSFQQAAVLDTQDHSRPLFFQSRWRRRAATTVASMVFLASLFSNNAWSAPSAQSWLSADTITTDVIFAYYAEPIEHVADMIRIIGEAKPMQARKIKPRYIIYSKSDAVSDEQLLQETNADEVIHLTNRGRESETYLYHIIEKYNSLADQTLFFQEHFAWWPKPREKLEMLRLDTGFLHLGHFTVLKGNNDEGNGVSFPRLTDYWNIFQESFMPPYPRVGGWSAQMAVSRQRIHEQPLRKWKALKALFDADDDHWVHQPDENHSGLPNYKGGFGSTNPAFGHALERSWPAIFNCSDISLWDKCAQAPADESDCQCLDA